MDWKRLPDGYRKWADVPEDELDRLHAEWVKSREPMTPGQSMAVRTRKQAKRDRKREAKRIERAEARTAWEAIPENQRGPWLWPIPDVPCLRCGGKVRKQRTAKKQAALCRECSKENSRLKTDPNGWYRKLLADLKAKPCMDCGQSRLSCAMDFDHRPGEGKDFDISDGWQHTQAEVLVELARCDLVCACCHRERTWKRTQGLL